MRAPPPAVTAGDLPLPTESRSDNALGARYRPGQPGAFSARAPSGPAPLPRLPDS